MTEPKDSGIPGLDALAARYRRQTAPPGFTARVMAAIDRPAQRAWYWQPRWALTAAVLLVVAISLPLLRDTSTPPPIAQTGLETEVLASAADLLAVSDRGLQLSVAEIPDVMSVQSIADIPDPFS
jgi:hypothetical protein